MFPSIDMHTVTRASEADLHEISPQNAPLNPRPGCTTMVYSPLVETIESMAKNSPADFPQGSMADGSRLRPGAFNRREMRNWKVDGVAGMRGQGIGSDLLRRSNPPSRRRNLQTLTGSLSEGNIRLYIRHGYAVYRKKTLSPTVSLVYMKKTRHGNSGNQ